MRIVVASVLTPFVRGGAEVLADELVKALVAAGHQTELFQIPFNPASQSIPDQMLACALMNVGGVPGNEVDRLIALKFPAYLIPHHHKVVWLLHHFRAAYDLWDHSFGSLRTAPYGALVRDIVQRADSKVALESKAFFTLSANVSRRVSKYWKVNSTPLHHPPASAELFYCANQLDDFLFFPSRLAANKRQDLALQALALTRNPVRLKFAGTPDSPPYFDRLDQLARELGVGKRIEWMGFLSEAQKRDAYARSLAVLFPPFDEDYGYVTLEAMLASKAVITCDDSGGPLEFVLPNETGLVTAATPESLAAALDTIWADRDLARTLGQAGRKHYDQLGLSWNNVVRQLTA